jgi:hypothetical protein
MSLHIGQHSVDAFVRCEINSPQFGALGREMARVKNGRYMMERLEGRLTAKATTPTPNLRRRYLQDFLRSLTYQFNAPKGWTKGL